MADATEFDAFVATRSQPLLRTAYLLLHDEDRAEDLLQTALTKAWFAWGRITGDPEPYFRRILVAGFYGHSELRDARDAVRVAVRPGMGLGGGPDRRSIQTAT